MIDPDIREKGANLITKLEVSGGHQPHASVKFMWCSIVTKLFSIATAVPRMTHQCFPENEPQKNIHSNILAVDEHDCAWLVNSAKESDSGEFTLEVSNCFRVASALKFQLVIRNAEGNV